MVSKANSFTTEVKMLSRKEDNRWLVFMWGRVGQSASEVARHEGRSKHNDFVLASRLPRPCVRASLHRLNTRPSARSFENETRGAVKMRGCK